MLWSPEQIEAFKTRLRAARPVRVQGETASSTGNLIVVNGVSGFATIGETCEILPKNAPKPVLAEIVGFTENTNLVLPYAETTGISAGDPVVLDGASRGLRPDASWLGRVIDALGQPIDGKGALRLGPKDYPIQAAPPPPGKRRLVQERLSLGVKALDLFTPCCRGQRLGIFAGSGVGKSSLVSMLAANSDADVLVIGLIGERGRELNEFLTHVLGEAGLKRSVVVAATSDAPAMLRRRAAYVAMTVAEYFRDRGLKVLCLMDSVTRFAMALREIYLAAGEPPTSKGYPPGVFAELPRLLERAGPGEGEGDITGLFSVLVEGDDTNEPVSDTVRGILDGHIIMDRSIAEAGRYPAVDVLKSLSRTAPACYDEVEWALVRRARGLMQAYAESRELIELGAYRGGNPILDEAIRLRGPLEDLLAQRLGESADAAGAFAGLAETLGVQLA